MVFKVSTWNIGFLHGGNFSCTLLQYYLPSRFENFRD
uniref:Uncharacterized protein n=1 Tax=Glycine max TaxID=3847 RepID=A0A0R0KFP9_SOYBN